MKTFATLIAVTVTTLAVAAMPDDPSFFEKAGQAGLAEVEAGRLAATKGASDDVRKFGTMMVEQHGDSNKKLATLAKSKGLAMPTAPSAAQTDTIKALQAKDGARFGQEYMAAQVKAHEEAVKLLKSQIASSQDEATKALAREMLPTVQSHLQMAYRLTGQEDKTASTPERQQ